MRHGGKLVTRPTPRAGTGSPSLPRAEEMTMTSVRIELVVFGVEGTTIRPAGVGNECVRKALIAANIPVTRDAVFEMSGIPKPVAIRRLISRFIGPELATEERVSEIHADFLH